LKNYQRLGINGVQIANIKIQGPAWKRRGNARIQLHFNWWFDCKIIIITSTKLRSLENQETRSFCNDCSPSLYSATALPLKAETFRPLAANADVFFIEGVGYGAFRRPAVTTTEAAAGFIKAEERRPREGERRKTPRKTKEQNEGRFWSINQQHLVLLPPSSSSWTEKTRKN